MADWRSLNDREKQLLRELGKEPEGHVVNRVGKDYLVFLNMRSREETVVALYKREGNHEGNGKKQAASP